MEKNLLKSIGYLVGNQICLKIPRLGNDIHDLFMSSRYRLTDEEKGDLRKVYETRPWSEYISELNKFRVKYLPKDVKYYSHHLGIFKDIYDMVKEDTKSFTDGIESACWDDDFFEYSYPEIEFLDFRGESFVIKFKLSEDEVNQDEDEEDEKTLS